MPIALFIIIFLTILAYHLGKNKAEKNFEVYKNQSHTELSGYYGTLTAIWTMLPFLIVYLLWSIISIKIINSLTLEAIPLEIMPKSKSLQQLLLNSIINVANGGQAAKAIPEVAVNVYLESKKYSDIGRLVTSIIVTIISFCTTYRKITPNLKAKHLVERAILTALFISSIIAVLTTVGIVLSLIFETLRFFKDISLLEFFFGTLWSPQIALREGQVAAEGSFGAVPVFLGTLVITFIAILLAGPIGLFSAIYLSEYSSPTVRKYVKPSIEILAGVPTVVYGFFAALVVGPFIRRTSESLGFLASSESALATGIVMGIMIIPFISSLSDDIIHSVPQSLREASYGVGATKSETIKKVIIPAALPGIVAAFLLAISRAIGETMIVVMAAGLSAKMTINPFEAVTTVTVQIVTLLVGDHEFDSTKTMAAFALGMTLFSITLVLNIIALRVVKKYREQYE